MTTDLDMDLSVIKLNYCDKIGKSTNPSEDKPPSKDKPAP